MNGDPTKYPEWYRRFLRGVAKVESAGGQLMMNPSSTATGLYGQLYSEVEGLPMLEGVTREEFAADTALQRQVMGERFEGNIPGIPGLMRNARELTAEYKPQLGEKFTFRPDEVAALTNYLGRQRTREYFASIRDDKPFEVPGKNKTPEDYLEEYNRGFEEEYRFGGKIKKKKQYQQGGLLAKKDPTLVPDPPEDDVLARLSLGIQPPPDQQFRLTGGDAPFRTIKEQKDVIAEQESEGDIMEILRYLPVTGEAIDAAELAKVFATGEDIYGEEQDPATFAAMTAAGYVIPNVLEKPLKSAWRAVKKFPAKMPKREFRELPTENREAVLQNLTQAHEEAYPDAVDFTMGDANPNPFNVRQLPSLMSGSKLENAVGKDGLIQVSQIENLINSKDVSAAEKEALKDALFKARVQQGEAVGLASGAPLPDKIDYLNFKRAGMGVMNRPFYVDQTSEYADYGLDELNLDVAGKGRYSAGLYLPDIQEKARTNIIRTTDPDLQSTEYGHFGSDVIGHYRTFERPDEKGVLYISELQADPLQARGPAGEKRVGLDIREEGPTAKQANLIKNQDQFLISHILEQEAKGADKLRFPTGETTAKIQSYGDPAGTISRAKADVEMHEANVKANRESSFVKNTFERHPMFKGKSDDEVFEILDTESGSTDFNKRLSEGYRQAGMLERSELFDWYFATQKLRSARAHLSRVNASNQATQGIMKGYDRLPKALKKHGLDATKVTDDVGNTWWEVDIPARLGEGVGEIRAYRKGGQVSDKIRVLKKEGYPQKQAVAIALAMQQKGQL